MPHTALPSFSSKKRPATRIPEKHLNFSTVEVISDNPKCKTPRAIPQHKTSSKLRRSPTPVLYSLTDLTNAHFHQLASVWHETSLPSFESDKRAIEATRRAEKDPFDF